MKIKDAFRRVKIKDAFSRVKIKDAFSRVKIKGAFSRVKKLSYIEMKNITIAVLISHNSSD